MKPISVLLTGSVLTGKGGEVEMIQIDIDMPTDCVSCWIRQNMGCKIANESGWLNNRRDDKCPLKEQKPVEPKKQIEEAEWIVCGNCNKHLIHKWKYCPYCGRSVKWE